METFVGLLDITESHDWVRLKKIDLAIDFCVILISMNGHQGLNLRPFIQNHYDQGHYWNR